MKGEQITDLSQLIMLAQQRKSVWVNHWSRTSPASFFLNWTLKDVIALINNKVLFHYTKQP